MAETQPITIENARSTLKVIFSEATTPEERVRSAKLASTAFGKSLTPEGYLGRDEYLASQPLARGTGWRWWCLTLADNPEQVLAMCKTMHRDLLIRDSSATRQEQGYCICSVVTDSTYRGRGLASVLLKKVAEWLDGPGNATASILYSDVGDFYVSKGWDILDSFESILTVPPSVLHKGQAQFPETRPLTTDDIPRLCERDVECLKDDFQKYDLPKDSVLVTILPTTNMITWLQARIAYMNNQSNGKTPEVKGSICESADSWIYWYSDLLHRKMTIQRVKLPRDQDQATSTRAIARLLLDAIEEAAKWELLEVDLWNPSPELHNATKLLNSELGIKVTNQKRESEHIPCLRWRGGEKRSIIFSPNEFYPWS
ncbi:Lysine acetyltransferase [Daldinia childiae]|uniref:Lysine acetyltransferase n=1 Tax=Daldinia childiae TaxID=326645 RepID=UPI001444FA64|nr:Lysine acetyltransferase [Daldinia childiae]KAF3066529.1 Lysine acetyltransferase [Daldinia childiae]